MKDYAIMTDSCCDLPREYIAENHIPFASLTCVVAGKEYSDNFGKSLNSKVFFDLMRKGEIPKTSQPNAEEFYMLFKEIIKQDMDIIYVCLSSALSGSLNSANIAKNMIKDDFVNAKIQIVDTLAASLGQGLMVMKAVEMKKQGKSFENVVDYLETHKQKLNTYITVDDLNHLKRGGRISSAAATLGMVLHIKPVLTINHEGRVNPVLKVKGRKNAISKLSEFVVDRIENPEEQIIAICHGDCVQEALKLKEHILKSIKVKNVLINHIGPVVGTYGGPGALAVFFMGKERNHHIIER